MSPTIKFLVACCFLFVFLTLYSEASARGRLFGGGCANCHGGNCEAKATATANVEKPAESARELSVAVTATVEKKTDKKGWPWSKPTPPAPVPEVAPPVPAVVTPPAAADCSACDPTASYESNERRHPLRRIIAGTLRGVGKAAAVVWGHERRVARRAARGG